VWAIFEKETRNIALSLSDRTVKLSHSIVINDPKHFKLIKFISYTYIIFLGAGILIRMKLLKLLILLLLILLSAGCIDSDIKKKDSASNSSMEELLNADIENFIVREGDNSLPDGSGSGEERETVESESAAGGTGSVSPNIPDVPTYPEEKSNVVYPKEYRLLSLNFQRAIGSGDEKIAAEVFNITGKTSGYDIKDACDAFDYVNKRWQYRYDKNAEFFFGASQTINDGYNGDCDDYSIVMSALLRNMGFNTRIVTGTSGDYGHAYPELYIGHDQETTYEILSYVQGRYSYSENIWYSSRELGEGKMQYWLNFDWSGSNGYRHPGGEYFEGVQAIYYPNGLIEF